MAAVAYNYVKKIILLVNPMTEFVTRCFVRDYVYFYATDVYYPWVVFCSFFPSELFQVRGICKAIVLVYQRGVFGVTNVSIRAALYGFGARVRFARAFFFERAWSFRNYRL